MDKLIVPKTVRTSILVADIEATIDDKVTRVQLPRNGYIRNISVIYEGTCTLEAVLVTNEHIISTFNRTLDTITYSNDETYLAKPYTTFGRLKNFNLDKIDGMQGLTGADSFIELRVSTHTRLVIEFWHLGV